MCVPEQKREKKKKLSLRSQLKAPCRKLNSGCSLEIYYSQEVVQDLDNCRRIIKLKNHGEC